MVRPEPAVGQLHHRHAGPHRVHQMRSRPRHHHAPILRRQNDLIELTIKTRFIDRDHGLTLLDKCRLTWNYCLFYLNHVLLGLINRNVSGTNNFII